jgi:acyl carrier protein
VKPTDDFFALGGNSLAATRLMRLLRERFEVKLPLRSLFDAASPRAFAARLQPQGGAAQ